MRSVIRTFKVVVAIVLLAIILFSVVSYYPYIFSKKVDGVLVSIAKNQPNVAFMQNAGKDNSLNSQLFMYAVAIRTDDGEIVTASTVDRQWAAALQGRCVTATYFPFPPWDLAKGGTYYNARLDRQYDCPERAAAAHKAGQAVEAFATPTPPEAASDQPVPESAQPTSPNSL